MNIDEITETIISFNHIEADIKNLRTIAESLLTAQTDGHDLAEITIQIYRPMSEEQKAKRKKTGAPRMGGFIMEPGKPAMPIEMDEIGQHIGKFLNTITGEDYKNSEPNNEDDESLAYTDLYEPTTSVAIVGLLIAEKQNERKLCLHKLTKLGVTLPTI